MSAERAYLGVEIGELAAWVTVGYGKTAPERHWRTRFSAPPSPDIFLARLAEGVREVCEGSPIAGIGIASWAPVDSERGAIRADSSMPDWADLSLTARLGQSLGAPSRLHPAVDAAALAEGAQAAGASPLVYVHLGREVLCSLVYRGAPALGAHSQVGHIGHWRVTDDGPRCACGETGHLNPLCSSQGFVRLAIGLAAQDADALAEVSRATGGRVESLTAQRIVALASAGVEPLGELVTRSADALGTALAQLALVVNPELIVLGGPLGVVGGQFMERTRERLAERLRAIPSAGEAPHLAPARLDPHSALTGALLLGQGHA